MIEAYQKINEALRARNYPELSITTIKMFDISKNNLANLLSEDISIMRADYESVFKNEVDLFDTSLTDESRYAIEALNIRDIIRNSYNGPHI
jgi:hypothetical protein